MAKRIKGCTEKKAAERNAPGAGVDLTSTRKQGENFRAACRVLIHGTRDAAQTWEAEHPYTLTMAGLKQGAFSARGFCREPKNLRSAVRGDDFTALGTVRSLVWLREVI